MSAKTGIEWTDATWNPVTGCDQVSEGCDNCYAKDLAHRWWGHQYPPNPDGSPRKFEDVRVHPNRLDQPRRWRDNRRVFVNSVSDLFHDAIPDDFIVQVFEVMADTPQHVYQVLTKRPGRMASLLGRHTDLFVALARERDVAWPLPNVWLGTSVENQRWADIRIPTLFETPAAVRFLSAEPLLGPIDLEAVPAMAQGGHMVGDLDWVIVGGESGPRHRPMSMDWVRGLRDQCEDAGVAFFFKQVGGRTPKAGGRELDGRTWDEMPDELRALQGHLL